MLRAFLRVFGERKQVKTRINRQRHTKPGVPTSHPFIERLVGSIRREFLDHMLFFNEEDLQRKLDLFKDYYNNTRAHSSLEMKTPKEIAVEEPVDKKVISLNQYRWKSHCKGLYNLPVAV